MPSSLYTRLRVLCSALLLAIFSNVAPADNSGPADATTEKEQNVFRFNVSPNGYPPYLITEEDGTSGIMWDVVDAIMSRIGYRVEAMEVPRKRVDPMLLGEVIDGTTRAIEWTDHPDQFIFTDPIVKIEEVLFFPKHSSATFGSVTDLFSLTLVTHLGYHYPVLESHFESGQIKRFDVSRDQDMFDYVLRGDELDAAIADRLVGQWILLNDNMQDQFRTSQSTLSEYQFRLMVRPEWQDFVDAFNRELAAMKETGELDQILSKYR